MKRILFVDAEDRYVRLQQRFSPLWPGYLAAYIEKHLGGKQFEFRLVKGHFAAELKAYKPHLVAISSVSSRYSYAMEYARLAKRNNLPVVIGGIHITTLPHTLTSDMDAGCVGEGGQTFLDLLTHFLEYDGFDPQHLADIPGIVYRHDGVVVQTPARPILKALDQMPHPKRTLAGYHRSDTMITSRGCPFKCVFCSVTRFWPRVNFATSDYVIEEIDELIHNGAKIIKFYDDLFTVNEKRLCQISEMITRYDYNKKVRFACWARASNLSEAMVDMLKAMNVVAVEMGLESGCDRSLKFLKGSASVDTNLRAVSMLKKAGIQTNGSFIIAAPTETFEEIMETYDFIRTTPLDTVTVNTLIPFPGTPIWDYAKARGLVSDSMDWRSLYQVTVSEVLSAAEIAFLRKKFKKLSLRKRLKALPHSPWLGELPRVASSRLAATAMRRIDPRSV